MLRRNISESDQLARCAVFERPTIFLLENDDQSRCEVADLIESHTEWDILKFSVPNEAFFQQLSRLPMCVVLEYDLPDINGLEVHTRLVDLDLPISTVFLSEGATVKLAVQIMEKGAVSLIEKPCNPQDLIAKVNIAMRKSASLRKECNVRNSARAKLSRLTIREQMLVFQLLTGKLNKQIAMAMDISLRTVERRRQSIFNKTDCESVYELAKLVQDSKYQSTANSYRQAILPNQVS